MADFHRVFLGACPDASDALRLAEVVRGHLGPGPYRLLDPASYHATLCFYPKVSGIVRRRLAELTSQVDWHPISVTTLGPRLYGRNAIGVPLQGHTSELWERMAPPRSPLFSNEKEADRWSDRQEILHREPLATLVLAQDHPEMDRHRRSWRGLDLHITVARSRGEVKLPEWEGGDTLVLSRLCLFESELSEQGSTYRVLATAGEPLDGLDP